MSLEDIGGVSVGNENQESVSSSELDTVRSVEDAKNAVSKVKESIGNWPTQREYNESKNSLGIGTGAGHFKRQTGHTFGEVKEMLMDKKGDIINEYGDDYNIVGVTRNGSGYKVDLECEECGDRYTVGMYRVRAGQKKYCSSSCAQIHTQNKGIDMSDGVVMAYLGGVYVGDGSVGRYDGENAFRVNTIDKELRDEISSKLELVGCNTYKDYQDPKQENHSRIYYVRVRSKRFCDYLEDKFSKNNGIVNYLNIGGSEEEIKFIKGFYESEGTYDGKYNLSMSQKNKSVLDSVKLMLQDLGYESSIYRYEQPGSQTEREGPEHIHILKLLGGKTEINRFMGEVNPIIRNDSTNSGAANTKQNNISSVVAGVLDES